MLWLVAGVLGRDIDGLRQWFVAGRGRLARVEAVDTQAMGVGLVVTRPTFAGEILLSAPRSLCLSRRDGPEWAAPSCALAARLCIERRRKDSPWATFLANLPNLDSPACWTDLEAELIAGTRAFRARRALLDDWKDEWPSDHVTWTDFVWAKTVAMSRTFNLGDDVGPVLIPFLDLANHADSGFCALDIHKEDQVYFSLVAPTDMQPGDTVVTNYFGGQTVDPVKALDAFGWIAFDFCVVSLPTARVLLTSPRDVDTKLVPALNDARHDDDDDAIALAIDVVHAARAAIEHAEPQRVAAQAALGPANIDRLPLARAIVDSERRALDFVLARLYQLLRHSNNENLDLR